MRCERKKRMNRTGSGSIRLRNHQMVMYGDSDGMLKNAFEPVYECGLVGGRDISNICMSSEKGGRKNRPWRWKIES